MLLTHVVMEVWILVDFMDVLTRSSCASKGLPGHSVVIKCLEFISASCSKVDLTNCRSCIPTGLHLRNGRQCEKNSV